LRRAPAGRSLGWERGKTERKGLTAEQCGETSPKQEKGTIGDESSSVVEALARAERTELSEVTADS